ncbi:MAG: histidine kinase [Taibaiella sp.]|nr:histidine kinase [Taibaiella sp.]
MQLPNLLHDHGEISDESHFSGDETLRRDEINGFLVGKWYQHLIGVSLFIIYEVTIVKLMGVQDGVLDFVSIYLLDISLFYVNGLYLIPMMARLGRRMQLIWLIIYLLLVIVVESIMQIGINHLMRAYHTGVFTTTTTKEQYVRAIWRAIYIIGLGWAYWIAAYNYLKSKAENELLLRQKEIERQNMILENAYLQARIAPHFLFNTLNFIYSSAIENVRETAPAIAGLSDMMRYSLTTPGKDGKINLGDELQCIDRLVEIVCLRFGDRLNLRYTVDVPKEIRTARIPPHILVSFAENMTKHGVLTDKDIEALIDIRYEGKNLEMYTYNKKLGTKSTTSLGTGISNTIKRLDYHYPNRYRLIREDGDIEFKITLKIKL